MGAVFTILAILSTTALFVPAGGRAQRPEENTYEWQFLIRAVDWDAIERLQAEVRDYEEEGAIGRFEIHITGNGARYDALVLATVIDPEELARLRELVPPDPKPGATFSTETRKPSGDDPPIERTGLTLPQRSI